MVVWEAVRHLLTLVTNNTFKFEGGKYGLDQSGQHFTVITKNHIANMTVDIMW